jgi:hypothetical protein
MKVKLFVLLGAIAIGVSTAMACSFSECGGGKSNCCKDVYGALYYCTIAAPPVKTLSANP